MSVLELASLEDSTSYLIESAMLMRTAKPTPEAVFSAFELAREVASEGAVTPPLGFLFDLAAVATGNDALLVDQAVSIEKSLFRRYDDYVLGRLYADGMLLRGGYAVTGYAAGDQRRVLAYIAERVVERADLPGVVLNPAVFKSLRLEDLESLLSLQWQRVLRDGLAVKLKAQLELLCNRMRLAGALLGTEDVFELEHQLALRPLSDRVALRHAWQASEFFAEALPKDPPPRLREGRQVATRIDDEDRYPVGGYASLSNRGTLESLLHSQLAYIEDDESIDLFDVKWLRNELLYFARDENTFYRRRKTIFVNLDTSLSEARVKDALLRWQRLTMVCGLLLCGVRQLENWLSEHALQWIVAAPGGSESLAPEQELFRVALPDEVSQQRVVITRLTAGERTELLDSLRERTELHVINIASEEAYSGVPRRESWMEPADTVAHVYAAAAPLLFLDGESVELPGDVEYAWRKLAVQLMESLL